MFTTTMLYHYRAVLIIILCPVIFLSCESSEEKTEAEIIIEKTIKASGGENYENAEIEFVFRDKVYKSKRKGEMFRFERSINDSMGNTTHDILNNKGLKRFKNQEVVTVPDSMVTRISDGVNSVHYFVQVPYVLDSPAARIELVGEDEVEGEPYYELKVTFSEKGGGTDHEDEFVYWIHKKNYTIGYLAYKFFTNKGGIRFRKAVNPRTIEGIRFVDYINYETDDLSTPLTHLDSLFEAGKLQFYSNINTENVRVKMNK